MVRIRTSQRSDRPQLRELWKLAFGDSDAYIDCFFGACSDPERVLVLESDGEIWAMTAWFDMPLVAADGEEWPGAYLYAVATRPERRGNGYAGKLLEWAGGWLWARGYKVLTTVPANAGLHAFFAANGFEEQFALAEREMVPGAEASAAVAAVDAETYGQLREEFLRGMAHVACGEEGLAYQRAVCELSGGGLFRAGSGCACVERAGDVTVVKELLAPAEEHAAILSALAKTIPARRWLVRTPCVPGQEGTPFAMYRWLVERPAQWPAESAYFGLAFD